MPTYEYECEACGWIFDRRQRIMEDPIRACPECHGKVRRLVSGGIGFILKGFGHSRAGQHGSEYSPEQMGKTCCGRNERCGESPCGDKS
ncbi:MAG: zinc ribbon domain-containing protein [Thermodesulfobacteriota bacterium]|jgi:putative FmdB family regulatory protein|nr:zinc ribbon domain-containing protein [Thermodesulfobacteriota bacterium]